TTCTRPGTLRHSEHEENIVTMKVFSTQLRFNTPAFLGDAEQKGVWRTPPIKALLRQFWRVAYAAQHNFKVDVTKMRHEEGMLFGYARDKQDMSEPNRKSEYLGAKKSLVRIRLESPDKQAPTSWIQGSQQGVAPLASSLDTSYAWFGIEKRGKGLPDRSGIQPAPAKEGTRLLRLAAPAEYMPQLE